MINKWFFIMFKDLILGLIIMIYYLNNFLLNLLNKELKIFL